MASSSKSALSWEDDVLAKLRKIPRENRPSIIIFDLDYTLWNCNAEDLSMPILPGISSNVAVDARGRKIEGSPDALRLLAILRSLKIPVGIASAGRKRVRKRFTYEEFVPRSGKIPARQYLSTTYITTEQQHRELDLHSTSYEGKDCSRNQTSKQHSKHLPQRHNNKANS